MASVTFTDLRNNLASHLTRVEQDRTELVVTWQGHPDLVVMPLAELRSMRETLHLLGTPANARRLMEGIREMDANGGTERELIEP